MPDLALRSAMAKSRVLLMEQMKGYKKVKMMVIVLDAKIALALDLGQVMDHWLALDLVQMKPEVKAPHSK